jgi:hypothetical protein
LDVDLARCAFFECFLGLRLLGGGGGARQAAKVRKTGS